MILSVYKFRQARDKFFHILLSTPYSVTLLTETLVSSPAPTAFDLFVGDSDRTAPVENVFNCLYDKIVNDQDRKKYGVTETVNGIVFLSPLQLVPIYGTFQLDIKKTKVMFEGRRQVIQKITYMESLYDSCVSVGLAIEDDLFGGK